MTHKTELVKQWALATHLLFAKDDSQSLKIRHHIESIGEILDRVGVPYEGDVMRAAYLHDILEDTPMDYELIWCFFDKDVGDLVYDLTDDTEGSRKERKTNTYRRIAKIDEDGNHVFTIKATPLEFDE